jgi:transposase-like protein
MFLQITSLQDLAQRFPDEQSCRDHMESLRWSVVVVSPFNHTTNVYRSKDDPKGRKVYRCRATKKKFNVLTNTIFHDAQIPLRKWFAAIYLIVCEKKPLSQYQLAEELDVTPTTAWLMLQKMRYSCGHENFQKVMNGETL